MPSNRSHQRPAPLQHPTSHARPRPSQSNSDSSTGKSPQSARTPSSSEEASPQSNNGELRLVTSSRDARSDTNNSAASFASSPASSSNQTFLNRSSTPSPGGTWWSADSRIEPASRENVPATPISSRSYLFTPTSSVCSTPPAWNDGLPRESLTLTFGVELEHIFAFNTRPGADFDWMFEDPLSSDEDEDSEEDKVSEEGHDDGEYSPVTDGYGGVVDIETFSGGPQSALNEWSTNVQHVEQAQLSPSLVSTHRWVQEEAPNWHEGAIRLDEGALYTQSIGAGAMQYSNEQSRYESMSMSVQKRILRRSDLECTIEQKSSAAWDLTEDMSVMIPDELFSVQQHLPGKNCDEGNDRDYHVTGHELVSRVLTAPLTLTSFNTFKSSPAMNEISNYLRAMHGTSTDPYGVLVNESCGLHVHVARNQQDGSPEVMLPLPILQHLAYLLVQFEELITSLHPPKRRAVAHDDEGPSTYIASNLMGLRRSAHICQRHAQVDLGKAQQKIFTRSMTAARLAKLMDTRVETTYSALDIETEAQTLKKNPQHARTNLPMRYKFVNFERINDAGVGISGKTIEFRQHRGTLDFIEIAHWVHFILSLIKAAERKALQEGPASPDIPNGPNSKGKRIEAQKKMSFRYKQGDKYKIRCDKLEDEFVKFFNLLEFDAETRTYWMNKFREYNPEEVLKVEKDEVGKERIVTTEEECPRCRKIKEQSSEEFQQTPMAWPDQAYEQPTWA